MALKVANQPFFYADADGVDHAFAKGDIIDTKDPAYKGREALFSDMSTRAETKGNVEFIAPDIEPEVPISRQGAGDPVDEAVVEPDIKPSA